MYATRRILLKNHGNKKVTAASNVQQVKDSPEHLIVPEDQLEIQQELGKQELKNKEISDKWSSNVDSSKKILSKSKIILNPTLKERFKKREHASTLSHLDEKDRRLTNFTVKEKDILAETIKTKGFSGASSIRASLDAIFYFSIIRSLIVLAFLCKLYTAKNTKFTYKELIDRHNYNMFNVNMIFHDEIEQSAAHRYKPTRKESEMIPKNNYLNFSDQDNIDNKVKVSFFASPSKDIKNVEEVKGVKDEVKSPRDDTKFNETNISIVRHNMNYRLLRKIPELNENNPIPHINQLIYLPEKPLKLMYEQKWNSDNSWTLTNFWKHNYLYDFNFPSVNIKTVDTLITAGKYYNFDDLSNIFYKDWLDSHFRNHYNLTRTSTDQFDKEFMRQVVYLHRKLRNSIRRSMVERYFKSFKEKYLHYPWFSFDALQFFIVILSLITLRQTYLQNSFYLSNLTGSKKNKISTILRYMYSNTKMREAYINDIDVAKNLKKVTEKSAEKQINTSSQRRRRV